MLIDKMVDETEKNKGGGKNDYKISDTDVQRIAEKMIEILNSPVSANATTGKDEPAEPTEPVETVETTETTETTE